MARIIAGPVTTRENPWGSVDRDGEWTVLTEHVLADEDGMFGFHVRWRYAPHWAEVAAYKIESERAPEHDGEPTVPIFDAERGETTSIESAVFYIKGYIKADGCAELEQPYDHWCGVDGFVRHCALLKYLWQRSRELMATEAGDRGGDERWPAEWPQP